MCERPSVMCKVTEGCNWLKRSRGVLLTWIKPARKNQTKQKKKRVQCFNKSNKVSLGRYTKEVQGRLVMMQLSHNSSHPLSQQCQAVTFRAVELIKICTLIFNKLVWFENRSSLTNMSPERISNHNSNALTSGDVQQKKLKISIFSPTVTSWKRSTAEHKSTLYVFIILFYKQNRGLVVTHPFLFAVFAVCRCWRCLCVTQPCLHRASLPFLRCSAISYPPAK